ncbi:lysophospholipid acyltransferase family protein [Aliiroseovarius sp. F47248L]|uniref:lysophospholipid acyltransferase family protein n=1 Tax=Aliiroseovarius sp. F47248L TaxID=2926420 RepID=UPI001FF43542|nr:lysophospholipid acyltransferase family protein [Aliiroseovarius sp. F47248L]MCK0140462.1 lysophospholipid acyltransferase family protein [Aliiroseovarius sp. F47248L]
MGQDVVNNADSDMVESSQEGLSHDQYDRRNLTYANSLNNPIQSYVIRVVEWFTGKISILRMVRKLEKRGAPKGQAFWGACLDVMGIRVETPDDQLRNIPPEGPVIAVANHPHGLVDGMVLAELIGRRRQDYRILSRSVLDGLDEVASSYMIPVPFPHDPEAQQKMVEMRAQTMAHLKAGGLVTLFPSGVVASSDTLFGPAIEREWNVFTAQLIRRSGAKVVPIYFPGSNSRWYQMANRLSATMRQALLLHEIVRSCNRPQKPVIGPVLSGVEMERLHTDPRGFMGWLRTHTLALGKPRD